MSEYPTLSSMGINNPLEIDRYHIHRSANVDTLRIVYKRKKGSLLASSRRYRFPLIEKTIITDSGSQRTEVVFEVSPALRSAQDELTKIVNNKWNESQRQEVILDEIERLESDFQARIAYIRSLMDHQA